MTFKNIYILPKYPDKIFVQWEVNNHQSGNYLFDIYISDNPEFGFEKINQYPVVNDHYYGFSFNLLTKEEYPYIKVKASINKDTFESAPQGLFYDLDKHQYLIVKEIIRKKDLNRHLNTGIKCAILKRRIFGEDCNYCKDIHTGLITDTRCKYCYGTGKLGGYHKAIYNNVEIIIRQLDKTPSELGTIENRVGTASITYPIVQKGDLIIDTDKNRRFRVNKIQRQILKTYPIDQQVDIRMISPKDIEYQIKY